MVLTGSRCGPPCPQEVPFLEDMEGVTNNTPPPKQPPRPTEAARAVPTPCPLHLAVPGSRQRQPSAKNRHRQLLPDQSSLAWHGAARHSTARRARREGLANKPVQGGGRWEARVIPLPKMLLLLMDGETESQEPQPSPAPRAPPARRRGQPNAAALPSAHGLTHGPEDGGQGPRCRWGHLPSGAAGFGAPTPNRWALAFAGRPKPRRHAEPAAQPAVGQGNNPQGRHPPASPGITYLWLQRPHPPHPKPSGGRCPEQRRHPSPGSPRRWPPDAGARRLQAWWRLSRGTKRTPGREAGQRLSAFAYPASTGGGRGAGGQGAQTQDALFSCRPVHVAGAGSRTPLASQPAPRGYSWIRPMAPSAARQERLEGGGGGEDMNQSGVPLLASGSWPVRQLPITQPGSVYSRSTTPHPNVFPAGRARQTRRRDGDGIAAAPRWVWGWSPTPTLGVLGRCRGPCVCCRRQPPASGAPRHTAWAVTASVYL